jgi:two-component system, OmpR family, sensor histidine kinase CreC
LKLSLRIFLVYFFLVGIGLFTFFYNAANQLRPILRQSAENSLVDIANLLAEILVRDIQNNQVNTAHIAQALERYQQHRLDATIWSVKKIAPDLGVYITNKQGTIIFHSDKNEIGKDYSQWIDVSRTLKGQYGARTTRTNPEDDLTSIMYVAAPIKHAGELIGVVTVIQPNASSLPFLEFARSQLINQGILILVLALVIGAVMTYWLTTSVRKLSIYVQKVRQGERVSPPKLHERELAKLAEATESMRQELEGKAYIENYIHTLTHEMKSPLAAIRGAAELLEEGSMDSTTQHKFLHNIVSSTHRMQDLIDHLLALAALENTHKLHNLETIDLGQLINTEIDTKISQAQNKNITIVTEALQNNKLISGNTFLLRQAISNLLENAIGFAKPSSEIHVRIQQQLKTQSLIIENEGPWIPDYALPRIFDRFYSLARADGSSKSSGLGLTFVQEIANLHKGTIQLQNAGNENQPSVHATLSLPLY